MNRRSFLINAVAGLSAAALGARGILAAEREKVEVIILLGGLTGPDGVIDSRGILTLETELRALPNVAKTGYWTWDKWENVEGVILKDESKYQTVVVGYSGGGSRATYLANRKPYPRIDLMVLLDPSPRWQMQPVGANVKRALVFHNLNPEMPSPYGELGGGDLVVNPRNTELDRVVISEQHLAVQYNQTIRDRVIEAVRGL